MNVKLHVPHIRRTLVTRPNLMRKLNEGLEVKLTLVSAQAGYGKTTALSEWAKQSSARVAWVSLGKLDNDWIQFWSYVMTSIQQGIPSFGESLKYLHEQESPAAYESAIPVLLNELGSVTGELVIVLDDFHYIELAAIHHSLEHLLEHLPSNIHFYIASRTDLAIPTARLLAKGEFLHLDMRDLRFELDEGIVFLRDSCGLSLTRDQAAELLRHTEGWVSGLQLAAINLKRSGNIAESIRQFSGKQNHISDYLLEEVFGHQPASVKEFLLDTSILSQMNAALCTAVTGQKNSQEQLERLERLNLFIVPLDDGRNWYRYHHLLSDFLHQIGSKQGPDRWVQAHIRAAKWFESEGLYEDAVEHYISGGLAADAVRMIESNLLVLRKQKKSSVLVRWLSSLPEESYAEKPSIEIFYITVLVIEGDWSKAYQRAERAGIRYAAMRDQWSEADWKRVMGDLSYFCGITAYLQQDLPRTSYYFEQLNEYLPEGSGYQTWGGNRYQGHDLFQDLLSLNNDLNVVEQFLVKWIKAWGHKENYPFVGYQYESYCLLLYEWNRLDEAEVYLNQAMKRKDLKSIMRIWVQLNFTYSWLLQAMGRPEQAAEVLVLLKLSVDSPDYDVIVRKIEAEQAQLCLRQGLLQEALDWMARCGLSPEDEVSLPLLAEQLTLARVLGVSGNVEAALELLNRIYYLLGVHNRLRDRIKVLIVQSVVYQLAGRKTEALDKLGVALQLAEPGGYVRSFIDEGPVMAELLSSYMRLHEYGGRIPPASLAYVRRLLQIQNNSPEEEPKVYEALTEQETKILRLMSDGLKNKEVADQLNITIETVKFHIKNIYRKLDAHNRVQVLQRAKQLMIL